MDNTTTLLLIFVCVCVCVELWKFTPVFGKLYQHRKMATKEGNMGEEIVADVHGPNGEEPPHHDGRHQEGNGHDGEDSTGEDHVEDTHAEAIEMMAAMPEHIKEAARTWSPEEFIEALSEGVELKRARKNGKGKSKQASIEVTPAVECKDPKDHGISVREVLKLMKEERRAERAACETQARRSAIPPRPPTFDGLSSGEHFIEEFSFYIENSGPGNPHPTDFTNSFAAFLTDRAKIWYKRLKASEQHNWDVLLSLFKTDFVEHFREEAKDAYKHRCQGSSETVESYSNDMDRLLSAAAIPKEEMVTIYVANLKSAIRRHVKSGKPTNIREAERLAREKEADIKESMQYFSPTDAAGTEAEDHVLQRLLDRVQSLTSSPLEPPPPPKPAPKEIEEELLCKLLEKIQLLQNKGKTPARKHTVASLSAVKPNAGRRAKSKAQKKREQAQNVMTPATTAQDAAPTASQPAPAPVYHPMHYPYFSAPMMPPMPQLAGQNYFPFPPPGYGSQVQAPTQPTPQNPASQNQGN